MDYEVVAVAFACEPGRGSEPGVGFKVVEALAEFATRSGTKVTVLTRPHKVQAIMDALPAYASQVLTVQAVSIPRWLVRVTGRRHVRIAYVVWQLRAVLRMRRMYFARSNRRLIVHHITFATEALPTFEWFLPRGILRVFGPAGSSQVLNGQRTGDIWSGFRALIRKTISRLNFRGVRLIVAQNVHAANAFRMISSSSMVVEPNIVLEPSPDENHSLRDKFGIVSVGLLTPLKRTEMAIECLYRLGDRRPELHLTIVGDGPSRPRLESLVEDLGVGDRVTFTGMVSREEAIRYTQRAQVLVHPSRQEGSAWVVGEAQSVGTIPVAFSGSGADNIIELASMGVVAPENTVESLTVAVERALDSPRVVPSTRWSGARLPGLLSEWYAYVLNTGETRLNEEHN